MIRKSIIVPFQRVKGHSYSVFSFLKCRRKPSEDLRWITCIVLDPKLWGLDVIKYGDNPFVALSEKGKLVETEVGVAVTGGEDSNANVAAMYGLVNMMEQFMARFHVYGVQEGSDFKVHQMVV